MTLAANDPWISLSAKFASFVVNGKDVKTHYEAYRELVLTIYCTTTTCSVEELLVIRTTHTL